MSKKSHVKVVRRKTGEVLIESAKWCQSWFSRLRGLQFSRPLKPGEAILMVHGSDSVATTSIHMFFVTFPIAAVWINKDGKVTSAQLAQPWRPYYASPEPARYVLETTPEFLNCLSVGDEVDFI